MTMNSRYGIQARADGSCDLLNQSKVDSRFRGNDGNKRLERACCLDVPYATVGRSAAVARFRRSDEIPTGASPAVIPAKAGIHTL